MKVKDRVSHVFSNVLLLWRTWNLHGFVLLSLCLQIFLFLAAPFRKKATCLFLVVSIWSAYQLVGTASDRSLALIQSSRLEEGTASDPSVALTPSSQIEENRAEFADLYTLWAAFLVVHFGGPDTITALSMEDNELWRRIYTNILSLIFATVNAVYAVQWKEKFFIYRPYIFVCTTLILISGIFKSVERVLSLSKASYDRFRESLLRKPNPVFDYAAIMDLHDSYKVAGLPVKFVQRDDASGRAHGYSTTQGPPTGPPLSDALVVVKAHHFFEKFKGMYIGMVYCCHDRMESRGFFLRLSSRDAFRVLETQMKFSFELFYTKMPLLSGPRNQLHRWICFCLEIVALGFWYLEHRKNRNVFSPIDVIVTWGLLYGTIIVDIIAFQSLYCSDLMIASSANAPNQLPSPFNLILKVRRKLSREFPSFLFRQWSESISQFNFINYCIDQRCDCNDLLFSWLGAKDMMDGRRYVSRQGLTNDLRDFIFEQVKYKALMAERLDIWKKVCLSRGSWVLRRNASSNLSPSDFEPWIMDVEYDESLLIWHIATELCFEDEIEPDDEDEKQHRRFSKTLSDYMLYLMVRQPKIMSGIAPAGDIIFKDTCSEARQLFQDEMGPSLKNAHHKKRRKQVHERACQIILEVPTSVAPGNIKDESKSVLFDACRLAIHLRGLKTSRVGQWKFTSQIWVDLLCYAAAQTDGYVHVIQLCAGGELLTLLRLLMLQLGLSNQFREATTSRSELVLHM